MTSLGASRITTWAFRAGRAAEARGRSCGINTVSTAHRMARARETLAEARGLPDTGHPYDGVYRVYYYAGVNAVSALALTRGFSTSTPSQLQGYSNRWSVKTGRIAGSPWGWGRRSGWRSTATPRALPGPGDVRCETGLVDAGGCRQVRRCRCLPDYHRREPVPTPALHGVPDPGRSLPPTAASHVRLPRGSRCASHPPDSVCGAARATPAGPWAGIPGGARGQCPRHGAAETPGDEPETARQRPRRRSQSGFRPRRFMGPGGVDGLPGGSPARGGRHPL